eukprot:gene10502-biopygen8930
MSNVRSRRGKERGQPGVLVREGGEKPTNVAQAAPAAAAAPHHTAAPRNARRPRSQRQVATGAHGRRTALPRSGTSASHEGAPCWERGTRAQRARDAGKFHQLHQARGAGNDFVHNGSD